tara:strand:- start:278 stop:463 length:186 start_codon:yes stop_codon:yes gene_type:complete
MSLHDEIREAHPMLLIDDEPLPVGTELLVEFRQPDKLWIELKWDRNITQSDGFKVQRIPIT